MVAQLRIFLLLALSVTSYLTINGEVLTKDRQISKDETMNTARPETTSLQGRLRGVNMVTHHNRTVYGFKGIPFAEPPLGNLRFKAALPAGSWKGTLDASKEPNMCPQTVKPSGLDGDEDCLYLHVYTPKLPANDNSTLLPVMVFIFGGEFKDGNINSAAYGPNFLLDKDVLLVVPSYRFGVLGFLTTGDEVSPGNYGLKDVVLALEWIRDNIQYFGGDPHRVTLFGGSSGAMSVSFVALSDLSNGLFHQYITQSGSAINMEFSLPREIFVEHTIQLAEYLGCPTNASTLLVDCLRGFSAYELVDTEILFKQWEWMPSIAWLPTTEPDIEGAFITDAPANLFAAGKISDVPSIALVVRDEGLVHTQKFYGDPDSFEEVLDNIDLVLPRILGYLDTADNRIGYTEPLKSYYLNDLTANRSLLLSNYTDLLSDGLFFYPAYLTLQQQLIYTSSPQYFCSFEYRGVFGNTYDLSGGSTNYTGIAHGDEIIYLFENLLYRYGPPDFQYSETDWSMVDTMVQLWTSFATNGTPTIGDTDRTLIWEPYSSLHNYLRIGNGSDTALEMKYDFHKERMQFWQQLPMTTSGQFKIQLSLLTIALCLCVQSTFY